jgi:hypothetical protein
VLALNVEDLDLANRRAGYGGKAAPSTGSPRGNLSHLVPGLGTFLPGRYSSSKIRSGRRSDLAPGSGTIRRTPQMLLRRPWSAIRRDAPNRLAGW